MMNRREFIAGTVGVFLAGPAIIGAQKAKQYRTALIGCGWWGGNITREALASGECTIVALCDVDQNQLALAATELAGLSNATPRHYRDYRELLDKEKPEIVIVATPDHWHALITIAAVRAGADVYVEKPVSHTIREGRAMIQAARDTRRVVQVGTHRRVSPHNVSAMQFLKDGHAGKIGMVRCFVMSGGGPGEITPDSEPPAGLDWDFWCGPAPLVPFNKRMHPKGFREFLNFANGRLGDWGIHWLDQVLWWSEEKYPRRIASAGGRHIRRDNTDAPDTQVVQYQFESFTCTWEHRHYANNHAEKHRIGAYFYGSKGTLHLGWLDGWTFYPTDSKDPVIHADPELNKPDDQNIKELWGDLMTCVKTRKTPVCDIEIGHRSTNMSLLGMLSHKVGRSIVWDGDKERIEDDPEAEQHLQRAYRLPWQYPAVRDA
jgi:predicted dehydrogenase